MLHPRLRDRTGKSVRIAIIDSGVHAEHAHVGGVSGGIMIRPDGSTTDDFADRLGHGTAVTGVLRERLPDAELFAVRVFEDALATTAETLAAGITWAIAHEMHLVNLSLGTANADRESVFAPVLERAAVAGVTVVSAAEHDDARWWPGSMSGCVGVEADWECERTVVTDTTHGRFAASAYPRPIPGVPPDRNLRGVSFAVANVTALFALVTEAFPGVPVLEALSEVVNP